MSYWVVAYHSSSIPGTNRPSEDEPPGIGKLKKQKETVKSSDKTKKKQKEKEEEKKKKKKKKK